LQAEPGAGKSTALPLSLLDAKWLQGKKIIMLEPRRVAAKSIAYYLARQLGEKVGQRIGYQIKNEKRSGPGTQLDIVTEGILTRRLQNDPELSEIGLIIFDEFHERSLQADLSLLFSLDIQQSIREDLKLLVMSATINTKAMADYMQDAVIIECPGRAYPVSVSYRQASKERLVTQVLNALSDVFAQKSKGDVLVFLPGQGDIHSCLRDAQQRWGKQHDCLFLPLYGGLTLAQQEQALVPDSNGKKRVIFTTNIAETSLTIEGVTCVIDSGLEKNLIFDPTSGMTRLDTGYISKASAEQRKGRAGRTQAGECIRLWPEQKQQSLRDYQAPEIMTADLSSLILELSQWGAGNYQDTHWLSAPPKAHYDSALKQLVLLELLDEKHKITALGIQAIKLGLSPRLARMLLKAKGEVAQSIVCELAALLADRDIFTQQQGVDIVERLLAVQDYKIDRQQALKSYPIKRANMEQLLNNAGGFKRLLNHGKSKQSVSLAQLQDYVGQLLLFAYPDRLAKKRAKNQGRYQLSNGRGVFLFDDDALFDRDWLVVADCDGQRKEGRVYSAASLTYDAIEEALGDAFEEKEHIEFDQGKQKIIGWKHIEYGAMVLKKSRISTIAPALFQTCLREVLTQTGLNLLNWTSECEDWLSRAKWLGEQLESFPKISHQSLVENLDDWLLPYLSDVNSIAELKKVSVFDLLLATLSWDQQQLLKTEAPTQYQTPSLKSVAIRYDTQQGPTVSVQLQELFGEIETPMIACGQVPIRFELLSPARRPIQITSDLANFWKTSYFSVAKDMKGQYPRHRWPDEPLLEKAGRSIKPRKR